MSTPAPSMRKRFIAELLGTFMLVFTGTLAASTQTSALNIGLAFVGAAIGAIYAFGHISGAHINPAVTISLAARGRFPWREVVPYIAAQIIGAVIGSLVLASILGQTIGRSILLGGTYPNQRLSYLWGINPVTAATIIELIFTFVLVLTVLSTTEKESPSGFAGLAIGVVLGINVMLMVNISGGSMNPARSFGPALVSLVLQASVSDAFNSQWIYWVSPIIGGLIAALVHWIKTEEAS